MNKRCLTRQGDHFIAEGVDVSHFLVHEFAALVYLVDLSHHKKAGQGAEVVKGAYRLNKPVMAAVNIGLAAVQCFLARSPVAAAALLVFLGTAVM